MTREAARGAMESARRRAVLIVSCRRGNVCGPPLVFGRLWAARARARDFQSFWELCVMCTLVKTTTG